MQNATERETHDVCRMLTERETHDMCAECYRLVGRAFRAYAQYQSSQNTPDGAAREAAKYVFPVDGTVPLELCTHLFIMWLSASVLYTVVSFERHRERDQFIRYVLVCLW